VVGGRLIPDPLKERRRQTPIDDETHALRLDASGNERHGSPEA
jgi:hypothetical protein